MHTFSFEVSHTEHFKYYLNRCHKYNTEKNSMRDVCKRLLLKGGGLRAYMYPSAFLLFISQAWLYSATSL